MVLYSMLNKKENFVIIAIIVVVIVVIIFGVIYFSGQDEENGNVDSPIVPTGDEEGDEDDIPRTVENVVEMNGNSFSPEILKINVGETVQFKSVGSRPMWPATNLHPTHELYPGSSINKCNSNDKENIFDSCGGVNIGRTFSFTFTETGEWSYHDHTRPSIKGTIIVE
jgi:plastocyanin